MGWRECEECHVKMPRFTPRRRHPDTGKLLCPGCHPSGRGAPGRPIGLHGSIQDPVDGLPQGHRSFDARFGESDVLFARQLGDVGPVGSRHAGVVPRGGDRTASDLGYRYDTYIVKDRTVVAGPFDENTDVIAIAQKVGGEAVDYEVLGSMVGLTDPQGLVRTAADDDDYDDQYPRQIGTDYSCPRCGTVNTLPSDDPMARGHEQESRRCSNGMCGQRYRPGTIKEPRCDQIKGRTQIACDLRAGHTGDHEGYSQSNRNPGLQTWSSLHVLGHDSGDGETIYHCPFCGGGQVIARSDGTTECGFCDSVFTVQVQPKYPAMPQTINGVPQEMPGMPGTPGQPGAAQEPAQPDAGPSEVFEPPEAQVPSFQPPDGAVAASLRERMYVTGKGVALSEEAYLRHLAIYFAEDREAVIAQVRASR